MTSKSASVLESYYHQICLLYWQKKFRQVEIMVLRITAHLIKNKENGKNREKDLVFLEFLYSDFNDYYQKWLKQNKLEDKNIPYNSPPYSTLNYFIQKTKNPEKMSQILWSLGSYLMDRTDNGEENNIKKMLDEYKKLVKNTV